MKQALADLLFLLERYECMQTLVILVFHKLSFFSVLQLKQNLPMLTNFQFLISSPNSEIKNLSSKHTHTHSPFQQKKEDQKKLVSFKSYMQCTQHRDFYLFATRRKMNFTKSQISQQILNIFSRQNKYVPLLPLKSVFHWRHCFFGIKEQV